MQKCPNYTKTEKNKRKGQKQKIENEKGLEIYCALKPTCYRSRPSPTDASSSSRALSRARADTPMIVAVSSIPRLSGEDKVALGPLSSSPATLASHSSPLASASPRSSSPENHRRRRRRSASSVAPEPRQDGVGLPHPRLRRLRRLIGARRRCCATSSSSSTRGRRRFSGDCRRSAATKPSPGLRVPSR
jgi:hypothetical protein